MSDKKPVRYQLTIRLYEGEEQGELVTRTVTAKDPDDAIGQGFVIADKLVNEKLNFKLKWKITKCRQVGDPYDNLQPV